jgi:hypothetical protein
METETETGEVAERCDPGVEAPCYPGAEGSAGLGACLAGTHTCQPDGMSFGACVGAIVPVTEACDTPEDESCDGVAGCTGAPVWNLGFASGSDLDASEDANRSGLAVDVSGNVWVARSFLMEIEIEGEQLVSDLGNTVLAKFSPSGALLWARKVGSDEAQSNLDVTGLAALPEGGVAVIGTYKGPSRSSRGRRSRPRSGTELACSSPRWMRMVRASGWSPMLAARPSAPIRRRGRWSSMGRATSTCTGTWAARSTSAERR